MSVNGHICYSWLAASIRNGNGVHRGQGWAHKRSAACLAIAPRIEIRKLISSGGRCPQPNYFSGTDGINGWVYLYF